MDERLKNVFGGIDNTTNARDLPFAFGGSFLDKNEKDETALTTGDDETYEGTGGEDVEEGAQEEEDLDEEVAKQNALQLLEEEEYWSRRGGGNAQGESETETKFLNSSRTNARARNMTWTNGRALENIRKKFQRRRQVAKGGKRRSATFKRGDAVAKAVQTRYQSASLPTYELLMSAATRTFVMDRNDDDNVDVLDAGGDGKLQQQRPRKEYENENERDEALEEEVKNVQKGLLNKLYEGEEGRKEEEEEEKPRKKMKLDETRGAKA